MIHTVRIDDTTAAGKRFMHDFRRVRKGIEFENPAVTGKIPEGYMTGEEFWTIIEKETKQFCKENGIL